MRFRLPAKSWFDLRHSKIAAVVACVLLTSGAARADHAADIARIHIEAVGGRERIAALQAMRATGYVVAGGQQVRFTLLAARPDKVRIETERAGRTLVQGSDGVLPPWEFDTGAWPPRYRDMPPAIARTFAVDAEFDDPLITAEARGFTLEDGGETRMGGETFLRVLVTRKLVETYVLLVDPQTFLLRQRVEQRKTTGGLSVAVVTQYDDYRPVAGVLLPHQITLTTDGRLNQHTVIERVVPNPPLDPKVFSRPVTAALPAAK